MFTPTIKSIDKSDGRLRLVVSFSDGTNTVEDVIFTTPVSVKATLKNRCDDLNTLYSAPLTTGVFDTTPDVVTQTQAEIDKTTFFTDYRKWQTVKTLIDSGILTGNEIKVTALKTKVQNEFKPEYFDL